MKNPAKFTELCSDLRSKHTGIAADLVIAMIDCGGATIFLATNACVKRMKNEGIR